MTYLAILTAVLCGWVWGSFTSSAIAFKAGYETGLSAAPRWLVHNHEIGEGPGWRCPEYYVNNRLVGSCILAAAKSRNLQKEAR